MMDFSSWTTGDFINYGLYAVALITSIVAFSMTRIEWLRILIIVSSACYAIYYYVTPAEPLWLDVISEGGFVVLNLFMLGLTSWHASRANLTEQETHLYHSVFSELSKHDFSKLIKSATWSVHEAGDVLISDGELNSSIYYLFSGETEVRTSDGLNHIRKAGSILGELGYRLEQAATGTVTVRERSVSVSWNHVALRKISQASPNIKTAVDSMLSERMAMKLAT